MGEKRSYSDAGGSAGKLAKKTSGSDVASSKAKKNSSAGAPPKGQDQEGNAYWELSKLRRIGIAHFRNTTLINIREYYEQGGQMRPGKKGISLSLDQYKALIRAIPDINAALRDDGVAVSDGEDDDNSAAAAVDAGEGSSKAPAVKEKKAKAPKKSNIEATSDEDSS